jgi:hypothetical protein
MGRAAARKNQYGSFGCGKSVHIETEATLGGGMLERLAVLCGGPELPVRVDF